MPRGRATRMGIRMAFSASEVHPFRGIPRTECFEESFEATLLSIFGISEVWGETLISGHMYLKFQPNGTYP